MRGPERAFQFGEVFRERLTNCVHRIVDVDDSLVNVLDNRLHRTYHGVGVFRQLGDLIRDLRDLGRLPIQ